MPRDDSAAATVRDLARRFPRPTLAPDELFECASSTCVEALLHGCGGGEGDRHTRFLCARVLLEKLQTHSGSAKVLCEHSGIARLLSVACSCTVRQDTRALAVRCMAAAARSEDAALESVRTDADGLLSWACAASSAGTRSGLCGALAELLAVAVVDDEARRLMMLRNAWASVSSILGPGVDALLDEDVHAVLCIMAALLHSKQDASVIWAQERGNVHTLVGNLAALLACRGRHALLGAVQASALGVLRHTLALAEARAAMVEHGVLHACADVVRQQSPYSPVLLAAVALLAEYMRGKKFAAEPGDAVRARAVFEDVLPCLVQLLYDTHRCNYHQLSMQVLHLVHALVDADASFARFLQTTDVREALHCAVQQRCINTHDASMQASSKLLALLDAVHEFAWDIRSACAREDAEEAVCAPRCKRQKQKQTGGTAVSL